MGMRKHIHDIVNVFWNDEELLRLLYYPPEDLLTSNPSPLSPTLPNILDMDIRDLWEIRDDRVMLVPKNDDLESNPKCRIYVYAGDRRPSNGYSIARQDIVVDVFCHISFEKDQRSMWISDRINDLLVSERITGINKIDYYQGHQLSAPNEYVGYRHVYITGSAKR